VDDVAQTDPMPMDNCESGADIKYHLAKDFNGLADIYWVLSFLYSFLLFRISRSKTIGGCLSQKVVVTNIFVIFQICFAFKLSIKIIN
jgi:hypothetical protein